MIKQFKYILISSFFSILISNVILVPQDYTDIQSAINVSMENDTIMVSPGTYMENININNHSIFLISTDGPINTIINGSFNGSVINIDSPGNNIEINGFTIQSGIGELLSSGSRYGGGIISHNTALTLDSLIIENNEAFAGGGICIYNSYSSETESILKNSTIQNNTASEGGGIFIINQSLKIINSDISQNGMIPFGSGGGIQALVANINIENSIIENNQSRFGGGLYIASSNSHIDKTIISNNISDSHGGGIWVGSDSESEFIETLISDNVADGFGGGVFNYDANIIIDKSTIVSNIILSTISGAGVYTDIGNTVINNSIIYFNRLEDNDSINENINGSSANNFSEYNIDYSNIEGNQDWIPNGIGIISSNPGFTNNLYHLSESSVCIDAGNPAYTDPDGTRLDIGKYYYDQSACEISGDINNDNIINVLDVVLIVSSILNNNTFNICYDMNEDSYINVLDIIIIVNIILNTN